MSLEQQLLLNEIQRRAASGQIGGRQFLHLAAAIGVESTFAVALADQVIATPSVQDPAGRSIESSYDYIVIGAGSAGCTIAARLSADPICRVLLVEAGNADINRPALQNPLLWPSNF